MSAKIDIKIKGGGGVDEGDSGVLNFWSIRQETQNLSE
jgi:hypothetical protein